MRTRIGVVLLCCWISTAAWAEDKPAAPVNPAAQRIEASAVMASLKRLVEDPAWNFAPVASRADLLAARSIPPETVRATEIVRASLPTRISSLTIWVLDHTTEQAAEAHVNWLTADETQRLGTNLGMTTLAKSNGGGKDGKRPGKFVHRSVEADGTTFHVITHVVRAGTLTIELVVFNVAAFDRATQDAHIEYALARARDPAVDLTPPAVPKLNTKARQVVIFVEDAFGEPVPYATVYLMRSSLGVLAQGECIDGHLAINAPLDSVPVVVVNPKSATGEYLDLAPAVALLDAEKLELRVRMAKGLSIRGQLVSAEGQPISDVRIAVTRFGAANMNDMVSASQQAVDTDAEGHFVISALAAGGYFIHAFGPDGAMSVNQPEEGTAAGATDVVLRLMQEKTMRVRVVNPAGEALAGVSILARQRKYAGYPIFQSNEMPITDADGYASISVTNPREPHVVTLTPAASQTKLATTVADLDTTGSSQTFALERGWTLRVRVVNPAGEPTAARVAVKGSSTHEQSEATDEAGFLSFPHLTWTAVEVNAFAPMTLREHVGDVHWRTIKPTDEEVTITAVIRIPVLVSALDEAGTAVTQAEITISSNQGSRKRSYGLGLDPLPRDVSRPDVPYRITISNARDSSDRRLNLAPLSVIITDFEQTKVTVTMERGATLTGRVLNENGTPALRESVYVSSHVDGIPNEHAVTDAAGRFSITGLHASKLKVSASTDTHSTEAWVTTTAGKSSDVVLTLKKK